MPRNLKIYIAGVVTLSAIALAVATFVFPADDAIALSLTGSSSRPSGVEIALGVLFWTALTLVTSALPVKLPLGSHQAVAMAPVVAAMTLGGPAVAGWVAAIGTTELREVRGPRCLVRVPGEPRGVAALAGRSRGGSVACGHRRRSWLASRQGQTWRSTSLPTACWARPSSSS